MIAEKDSDISIDGAKNSIDSYESDSVYRSMVRNTITVEEESDNFVDDPKDVSNSFVSNLVINTTKINYSITETSGSLLLFNAVLAMPDPSTLLNRNIQNWMSVEIRYCTHLACAIGNNYICICQKGIL